MIDHIAILGIQPKLIAAVDGHWLAVAGPGAPARVGVLEPSKELARVRFNEALRRLVGALERSTDG